MGGASAAGPVALPPGAAPGRLAPRWQSHAVARRAAWRRGEAPRASERPREEAHRGQRPRRKGCRPCPSRGALPRASPTRWCGWPGAGAPPGARALSSRAPGSRGVPRVSVARRSSDECSGRRRTGLGGRALGRSACGGGLPEFKSVEDLHEALEALADIVAAPAPARMHVCPAPPAWQAAPVPNHGPVTGQWNSQKRVHTALGTSRGAKGKTQGGGRKAGGRRGGR